MSTPEDFPEVDDLVLGTITSIMPHGVYIELEDHPGIQAYCHISEISGTWIRNIRNFVRLGQKVVAKVIRSMPEKNQLDVSIRRVPQELRRKKIQEYKRERNAYNLLRHAAQRNNIDPDQFIKETIPKLKEYFGNVYDALERSLEEGPAVFEEAGISSEYARFLHEIAKENIKISTVQIAGVMGLRSYTWNGVERVRDALLAAKRVAEDDSEVSIELYTIGAPRYRIEIEARDYQKAEAILQKALKATEKYCKENEVEFVFERDKK